MLCINIYKYSAVIAEYLSLLTDYQCKQKNVYSKPGFDSFGISFSGHMEVSLHYRASMSPFYEIGRA